MSLKKIRNQKSLSQEQLAEGSGISLRTIQRIERGEKVSDASLTVLANYFETPAEALYPSRKQDSLSYGAHLLQNSDFHRSVQIIILFIVYFVCISQRPIASVISGLTGDASLGEILFFLFKVTAFFTVFAYLFYTAKKIFLFTYYLTTALFIATAFALRYFLNGYEGSATYPLFFSVYFVLMLLSLCSIHIVQLATSLKNESVSAYFKI